METSADMEDRQSDYIVYSTNKHTKIVNDMTFVIFNVHRI